MIKTSTRPNPWNGKTREMPTSLVDSEFTDLEPTITYRHVLSNNLGVKDPLRVIALCDSDAFYAACEMVRLNVDKDVPLVVLQWDSLIAVNYSARQYGITRMIKVKDALHKCPHLKVVHVATYKEGDGQPGYWDNVDTKTHKVSLDYYRRESIKIATKFRESLPSSVEIGKNRFLAANCSLTILAVLEKASIDEAFFDYTKAVKEVLLQRFPYLAKVPQDAQDGIDTPLPTPPRLKWSNLAVGHLIPLTAAPSEVVDIEAGQRRKNGEEAEKRGGYDGETQVEQVGNHEATGTTENLDAKNTLPKDLTGDLGGHPGEDEQYTTTWHDVALSIAAELMDRAREKVREMGYTTSAVSFHIPFKVDPE